MDSLFFFVLLLSLVHWSHSFDDNVPRGFKNKGDTLEVKVNKLSSMKTLLPYDYYFLNYCRPSVIINSSLSLGQVLLGDRIHNSIYNFKMGESEYCKVACRVKLDANSANNFKAIIDDRYQVNLILDDQPAAVTLEFWDEMGNKSKIYVHGLPVGWKSGVNEEVRHVIYNHLRFNVVYHDLPETHSASIVGFEVTPYSVDHQYKVWENENTELISCTTEYFIQDSYIPQEIDTDKEIVFTYDVLFQSSDAKWESLWDSYLRGDDQINWFAMLNSLWTMILLSGVVAMVVVRNLYKDITRYNQLETKVEAQELTGWKLVHADVFRPPTNASLLCVCVGNGVQVLGMTLAMVTLGMLGLLSPLNQGQVITAMVLLWMFMGLFAGYSSARLYKMFRGTELNKIALSTAITFPAVFFGVLFMLNTLIWREKSCATVPFATMFAMMLLWFGVSTPLVILGSYLGFKRPAVEDPVKTNEIPREIPKRSLWHNIKWVFSMLIGASLPFSAVLIEFFNIWTSIYSDHLYYSFGRLFIVFVILVVTCSEVAILLCYFQLRSEDYNWWWRAFLSIGSSGLFMFSYSIFKFFARLEIEKSISVILYFSYMFIGSFLFSVLTGTIGFYACFWLVKKIYSSVKFD